MDVVRNEFKRALKAGRPQIGLWQALASPYTAELCAVAGFDWLLFDGEHGPNSIPLLLAQIQATSGYATRAVARVPVADATVIKQYLDIGVMTIVVPFVESAEQAADIVRACHYPPDGVRGVAGGLIRASRWGRVKDYLNLANSEICLLVQVESRAGMANISAIANTPGVDGIFIGPSDLAAGLGHIGKPNHPEVAQEIETAIDVVKAAGKAVGTLTLDEDLANHYLKRGCTFIAVGTDVGVLARAVDALCDRFKNHLSTRDEVSGY